MPVAPNGEIIAAPFQLTAEQILSVISYQHWDMKACECWVCQQARGLGISPTQEARDIYSVNGTILTRVSVEGRNH